MAEHRHHWQPTHRIDDLGHIRVIYRYRCACGARLRASFDSAQQWREEDARREPGEGRAAPQPRRWLSGRWKATKLDLNAEDVAYLVQLIEDDLGESYFTSRKHFAEDDLPVGLLERLTGSQIRAGMQIVPPTEPSDG